MERTPETKVLFHNHRRKKNNNGKTPKRKLAGAQLSDKKPGEISKRPDEELAGGKMANFPQVRNGTENLRKPGQMDLN